MKHLVAAIGIAVIGATALHGQSQYQTQPSPNAELTPQEKAKFWSVSAALRGFYDDNYTAIPKNQPGVGGPLRSFGVEVSPSLSLNWSQAETLVGASYTYDWKWYEKQHDTDETHEFNGKFIHNFSPRYRIEANDSFVLSSEPTVIDTTTITAPTKRTLEDNLRNRGSILFSAELTPILGSEIAYQNTLYDYREDIGDLTFDGNGLRGPSRSGLLDRDEHLVTLDLRWKALPETTGILGYQFQFRDFTSDEQLIETSPGFASLNFPASIRSSRSHFLFVGVDQSVGPNLRASVRVGAQYLDYYNYHTDKVSPYGDASLTYTYLPGSYVQVGVRHEHAATDILGDTTTIVNQLSTAQRPNIVLDQEATSVYGALTHRITARLTGSVLGQYQNSSFNGGGTGFNDENENFFLANLNLAYKVNPYLLTEAGYEFDRLDSKFGRDYTRNRVYIGLRGTY